MIRDINSIVVLRDERQRRELKGIEDLAESMSRIGLIQPIVIDENGVLLAGERRLTAAKALGWTQIETTLRDDLSDFDKQVLELDENIKRVDLSWQDQVRTIEKLHKLYTSVDPTWTQERTAESIGLSRVWVNQSLMVAENLHKPEVAEAAKFSVARGISERQASRRRESTQAKITEVMANAAVKAGVEEPEPQVPVAPILLTDFREWAASYIGPKFNMIHCDFPYGVGMHNSAQGAGDAFGTYADTEDTYWHLVATLTRAMENVVAESAHMIFWFSMDYYARTKEALEVMGWNVNPFPLIWHKSDNTGILPDPKRGPRRTYESAFFASRGDRQLATGQHGQGPVANSFAWAGGDKEVHMNEKPVAMLRHFMRLCVDEYSLVLDPTCGSGNALKAAEGLGAATVLGLEINEQFYARAVEAYYG